MENRAFRLVFILIVGIVLIICPATAALELAYDDGTIEDWHSLLGFTKTGHAVFFDNDNSIKISEIKVNAARYDSISNNVYVHILDGNLNVLSSNSFSYDALSFPYSQHTPPTTGDLSWVTIDVPDVIVNGDFYIVFFTDSRPPSWRTDINPTGELGGGICVGVDETSHSGHSYLIKRDASGFSIADWYVYGGDPQDSTDWMIRAGLSELTYDEWISSHVVGGEVKTTWNDPPPWKQNFQYPDWVWDCTERDGLLGTGECIELTRVLPINVVWQGTANLAIEDVISEFTEEGWSHYILQWYDFYVYDGSNWKTVHGGKTVATSPFRTGLDEYRYHVELFEIANGLIVGQAHKDQEAPIHLAIDCENVEWRILDYFNQATDTEWDTTYNAYDHGNAISLPNNDGKTTIIEYDFTQRDSNLYNSASVSCPVNLHAYVDGQHIGINGEGLDGIPDSVYNGPNSDPEEIVVYGEHSAISFEVRADPSDPEFLDPEARKFTLTTTQSTEEGLVKSLFVDVPVTANTIATVRNANEPVLVIDEDGDGEDDFTWNADMLINTYGDGEVNHAPTIGPIDDNEVIAGNGLTFAISYQDEDEDEDPLTTAFITTLPNGDEIAGLPEGATFDGEVFSWTTTLCQGGTYEFAFEVSDGGLKETATFTIEVIVPVAVDIDPDTLNLKSNGPYITAYIELPECYDTAVIDALSCCLDCDHGHFAVLADAPCCVGDYDVDDIPDMMVKFDREALVAEFAVVDFESDGKFAEVSMTLSGAMSDGIRLVGEDIIQVRI